MQNSLQGLKLESFWFYKKSQVQNYLKKYVIDLFCIQYFISVEIRNWLTCFVDSLTWKM